MDTGRVMEDEEIAEKCARERGISKVPFQNDNSVLYCITLLSAEME